jgi:hypothetical protein
MKINQSKAKISITPPKGTNALPKNTTSNVAIAAEAVAGTAPTGSIKKQELLRSKRAFPYGSRFRLYLSAALRGYRLNP